MVTENRKRSVRMICTVGTSLLGNLDVCPSPALNINSAADAILNFIKTNAKKGREKSLNQDDLSCFIARNPDYDKITFPSAEIQTLMRWLRDNMNNLEKLRIILLPSEKEDSIITAFAACAYINKFKNLFKDIDITCEKQDIIPKSIVVDDRGKFLTSVKNLFDAFDAQKDLAAPGEETVICASGGYKAITAFSVMYAQINNIPCLYTFEGSPNAFELMNIPIGFALSALDEEINMLKAIESGAIHGDVFKSLPQWVQDTSELAPMLIKGYEKGRRHLGGTGAALFGRLGECGERGAELKTYLEGLLSDEWAELWLGDQIPETVEHSRRHSKRLMEFTANLFRCAPTQMGQILPSDKPELLALFIAGIYLHDIGHTALSYPVNPNLGRTPFPLGLFPSSVREIHHLLTGDLLKTWPDRFFGKKHDSANYKFLKAFVPLLAAHHRGYTSLKGNKGNPSDLINSVGLLIYGNEAFEETLRPLEERFKDLEREFGDKLPFDAEDFLRVTALLRIIDGSDVQSDRIVSDEYLKARLIRTKDEANFLSSQFNAYKSDQLSEYNELIDKLKDFASSIDVDAVCGGNFADEGGQIENKCKEIYRKVFADLKKIKDKYGECDVWGEVQTKEPSLFIGLSLANRIAFKWEQFLHFYKHQSVSFVLPSKSDDAKFNVDIKIFPSDLPNSIDKIESDILGEIKREYDKVAHVLENSISFTATKAKNDKTS